MRRALILATAVALVLADEVATADQLSRSLPIEFEIQPSPGISKSEPARPLPAAELFNRGVHGNGDVVIGGVCDVLLSPLTGEIVGLIVGVGAFLGTGDKNIEISIGSVERTMRDNRSYLVVHATRQYLQNAEAVRFDGATSEWVKIAAPAM